MTAATGPKENRMTAATRVYSTWNQLDGHCSSLSPDSEVADALLAGVDFNDYTADQIAAVAAAYRDAINAALPEGVMLCGDQFYGPADGLGVDLAEIVNAVDFWDIVETVLD